MATSINFIFSNFALEMDKTSTHISSSYVKKRLFLFRLGALYKIPLPLSLPFQQWRSPYSLPSPTPLSAHTYSGGIQPWLRRRPPQRRIERRGCVSASKCQLGIRRFTRCLGFRRQLLAGRSRRRTGNWRGSVIRMWWRRIRRRSLLRFRRRIRHCRIRLKGRITTGRFTEVE